ncbi:BON domain-containing protein [Aliiglaciecola sp. LCG003]|uniref:BON domain-containing protein n=1 Tax=Aliiglaciecola sp. LCG003 TaxID=3053655 RepID=UPI00257432E6|nr:BON domain-containing protein [Aliiglaciecola sp. LCG003]WJG08701.1 BON domain-containing protein [Aliiglaciecola sp. LCG003]
MFQLKRHYVIIIVTLLCVLQGCAALVVGAGVGAASAAHDRRTLGTQVDDKTAAARLSNAITKNTKLEKANINITVFNGVALLVGQAPEQAMLTEISTTAQGVKNLVKVHNQVRIGNVIPASVSANDLWVEGKVKTALIGDKRIDGLHIKVVVEDSEVFLMGLVKNNEADIAVDIARNVSGVARVIKVFESL